MPLHHEGLKPKSCNLVKGTEILFVELGWQLRFSDNCCISAFLHFKEGTFFYSTSMKQLFKLIICRVDEFPQVGVVMQGCTGCYDRTFALQSLTFLEVSSESILLLLTSHGLPGAL